MKQLTPKLLQQLIDINMSVRKHYPQEEMLNPSLTTEFKTIQLNLGRATGHTHCMMHVATSDDLILISNNRMINHLKVAYLCGNVEITTFTHFESYSNMYLSKKRRYVWVDTASFHKDINNSPVLERIKQQPSAYDALILIG